MRIGMMADVYKPYISGVTSYIDLHKRALENQGHEVYVFTFGDLDHKDEEPRVVRSPGLPLADTGFYLSVRYKTNARKLLQSMDVVHVHHPFLSGRLALHYCRRKQIPIAFTNHTRYDLYAKARVPFMPAEVSQGLLQAYLPDFCSAVDLVISPSPGMKEVLQQYGVESHIEVVPNGVDLSNFHKAKPLRRADFGFKRSDTILIYAGRLAPEKNLEFLLQAFAGVSQVNPRVHLLVVGGAQQKEYEDQLRLLPGELGIADRVHFTGMVAYDQIPSYLAMGDVFVTPSITETFGMSTVEAMGVGLPAVGIHSPGSSDIIEEGKTGLLADNNMATFTAKLTYLCLNKPLIKKMGAAARKASEQYDIQRTASILLGHYQRLTQATKPLKQKLDQRLLAILEEFLNNDS